MDATFPTEAIILDRSYFREYDSRVLIYSREYGKMDLVVRGTRRPKSKLAGHVEPISQASLMIVKGKQFDYIGSARGLNSFSRLKENFESLVNTGKAIKMVKKLIEPGVSDEAFYGLLKDYLLCANKKSETGDFLYLIFVYKFISYLGYQPEFSHCLKCSARISENCFFDHVNGSVICGHCGGKGNGLMPLSDKTAALLKNYSLIDSGESNEPVFDAKILGELKNLLGIYVKYNLDFDI